MYAHHLKKSWAVSVTGRWESNAICIQCEWETVKNKVFYAVWNLFDYDHTNTSNLTQVLFSTKQSDVSFFFFLIQV